MEAKIKEFIEQLRQEFTRANYPFQDESLARLIHCVEELNFFCNCMAKERARLKVITEESKAETEELKKLTALSSDLATSREKLQAEQNYFHENPNQGSDNLNAALQEFTRIDKEINDIQNGMTERAHRAKATTLNGRAKEPI
jgi:hypothetical protein